jgi:hypothetical protein
MIRKEDNDMGITELVVIGLIIVVTAAFVLYTIRRRNA